LYYACFYAAGALLAKHKVEVNSHPGVNYIPRSRPMLKYGIQSLNENKIILPSSQKNWPDKDRLVQRFDAFRQVG
jgi:hypothetical protein